MLTVKSSIAGIATMGDGLLILLCALLTAGLLGVDLLRPQGVVAADALYLVFGCLLSPIIAGAAMSMSSVSVIGNALRLRNVKL